MSARLLDDLSRAEKLLDDCLDRAFAALKLVDPVSQRLTEEIERAINSTEDAHDLVARAVRVLDGSGF